MDITTVMHALENYLEDKLIYPSPFNLECYTKDKAFEQFEQADYGVTNSDARDYARLGKKKW